MYADAPTAGHLRYIVGSLRWTAAAGRCSTSTVRTDMNDSPQRRADPRLLIAVAIAAVLSLAACASTPPAPTASLTAARTAIADAEKAGAGSYANAELGEARQKLTDANSAVEQKDMPRAQRLAEQSSVEAELASANTAEAKAVAVNTEMIHSNDTLKQEIQREPGSQPGSQP